jgi:hypothetical protein
MKKEIKSVLWQNLPIDAFNKIGSHFEFSLRNVGGAIMAQHAFAGNGALIEMEEEGNIQEGELRVQAEQYEKLFESKGGRLVYRWLANHYVSALFLYDHGIAGFILNNNYLSASTISINEDFVKDLRESVKKDFISNVKQGSIFAIVYQCNRLTLSSIGNAGITLVRENYMPNVLEGYDYIVKDLNSNTPSGRIIIMEGEPGTGKTHLIRALLMEVPDAMFVLVSPEMVPSLAGPELLPLLLTNKNDKNFYGPIILVLEDADRCLVTRGSDNISSIQSLLNLGDGILGSLLDLRIVATTNAKKLDMEAAILRPGRLSKRLEVGPLDSLTAQKVFKRLCPNVDRLPVKINGSKVTLAEVYSMARQAGWEPEKREVKYTNQYLPISI